MASSRQKPQTKSAVIAAMRGLVKTHTRLSTYGAPRASPPRVCDIRTTSDLAPHQLWWPSRLEVRTSLCTFPWAKRKWFTVRYSRLSSFVRNKRPPLSGIRGGSRPKLHEFWMAVQNQQPSICNGGCEAWRMATMTSNLYSRSRTYRRFGLLFEVPSTHTKHLESSLIGVA